MPKESATGIRAAAAREIKSRPKNGRERGKARKTNGGIEGDKGGKKRRVRAAGAHVYLNKQ